MKKSKFTETQIIKALKENESGKSAHQILQLDYALKYLFDTTALTN